MQQRYSVGLLLVAVFVASCGAGNAGTVAPVQSASTLLSPAPVETKSQTPSPTIGPAVSPTPTLKTAKDLIADTSGTVPTPARMRTILTALLAGHQEVRDRIESADRELDDCVAGSRPSDQSISCQDFIMESFRAYRKTGTPDLYDAAHAVYLYFVAVFPDQKQLIDDQLQKYIG